MESNIFREENEIEKRSAEYEQLKRLELQDIDFYSHVTDPKQKKRLNTKLRKVLKKVNIFTVVSLMSYINGDYYIPYLGEQGIALIYIALKRRLEWEDTFLLKDFKKFLEKKDLMKTVEELEKKFESDENREA